MRRTTPAPSTSSRRRWSPASDDWLREAFAGLALPGEARIDIARAIVRAFPDCGRNASAVDSRLEFLRLGKGPDGATSAPAPSADGDQNGWPAMRAALRAALLAELGQAIDRALAQDPAVVAAPAPTPPLPPSARTRMIAAARPDLWMDCVEYSEAAGITRESAAPALTALAAKGMLDRRFDARRQCLVYRLPADSEGGEA